MQIAAFANITRAIFITVCYLPAKIFSNSFTSLFLFQFNNVFYFNAAFSVWLPVFELISNESFRISSKLSSNRTKYHSYFICLKYRIVISGLELITLYLSVLNIWKLTGCPPCFVFRYVEKSLLINWSSL